MTISVFRGGVSFIIGKAHSKVFIFCLDLNFDRFSSYIPSLL